MRRVTILIAMLTLAGCNTVQGVGRDVQGVGEILESGAVKLKRVVTD